MRIQLLVLPLITACSTFGSLPLEKDLHPHAEYGAKDDARENGRGTFTCSDGYKIAWRETRAGDSDRVIVLLHGLLSNYDTWRYIGGALGDEFTLLRIDHLGCGRSDKPDPDEVGPGSYSPTALARYVLEVLRAKTGNRKIALVGHSLGGMVILRMFGDDELRKEFADVMDRVDRAVLLSTVDFAIPADHETFKKIRDAKTWLIALANASGLLKELVAKSVKRGAVQPVPREEAERTYQALKTKETRRAAQGMIVDAIPTAGGELDWKAIRGLVKDYAKVTVPTLIVWGQQDQTFSFHMAYALFVQLPNAYLHILNGYKHSLPSEAPTKVADDIRAFVGGDPAAFPRRRDLQNSIVPKPSERLSEAVSSPRDGQAKAEEAEAHGRH